MARHENYKVKKKGHVSQGRNEKKLGKFERVMEGVATWASFYRANPHRLVRDYIGINLKLFQVILFFMMNHVNYFMYLASRGHLAV
jgi:hypothetical protein